MNNVIFLKDVKLKKKQDEENKELAIKKILNKRTALKLNYYEIYVFIKVCCRYMESLRGYASLEMINDDEQIQGYKYECKSLTRLLGRLFKAFKANNCILDHHFKLGVRDVDLLWIVFESEAQLYLDFDKEKRGMCYKHNYREKERFEKTVLYFYKVFRDTASKYSDEINKKRFGEEEFSKRKKEWAEFLLDSNREYEETLEYFKNSYVEEFLSYDLCVYEGDWSILNVVYSTYFLKPSRTIHNAFNKFRHKHESNSVSYMSQEDIDTEIETFDLDEYSYPYGSGYRVDVKRLTHEQFDSNENEFDIMMDYYEAKDAYDLKQLKNIGLLQSLNLKILQKEDVEEREMEQEQLYENILDTLEYLCDIYCGDWSLAKDGVIADAISKMFY